ncbi:MAG: PQQ-binding-like beta-propeller repeat protein, partial [Sandaracinaceae bacterium]|nr:PQQ-binding-like beta-propeller repeat protein [Sandaracinaceae bacterium]
MRFLALALPWLMLWGCGGGVFPVYHDWWWGELGAPRGRGELRVRWFRSLVSAWEGAYVPVEAAPPLFDEKRGRLYVGTSRGELWAITFSGTPLWVYLVSGGVSAQAALSPDGEILYFGSDDGFLYALEAQGGKLKWRTELRGALANTPLVTEDALFVVTVNDTVEAFDRKKGEVLWRYERPLPEGFSVTGHAGLLWRDGRLITAFTDGAIVAFDPSDGRRYWVRESAADLPPLERPGIFRPLDADATPVYFGGLLY